MLSKGLSTFLDFSRWASAAIVLVSHVTALVFRDVRLDEATGVADALVYCIAKSGHYAVMIFFVISGYLVGGITLHRWRQTEVGMIEYGLARVSRIYTVLIPALLIGLMLDLIGLHFFGGSMFYTGGLTLVEKPIAAKIGLEQFALNLGLLQNMYVDTLGSNVPLWSLANEWWYYCLFATLAGALLAKSGLRWVYAACAAGLLYVMPQHMLTWGLIWLMGLGAFFVLQRMRRRPPPVVGLVVIVAALVFACLSANQDYKTAPEPLWMNFGRDGIVALAFIFAMTCFDTQRSWIRGERFHQWAAGFSYSTYLYHFPLMLLAGAALHEVWGWPAQVDPSMALFAYVAALSAALSAACYALYWVTERHTDTIRRSLRDAIAYVSLTPKRA